MSTIQATTVISDNFQAIGGTSFEMKALTKAWARIGETGGTPSILDDVNMASITDNGVGRYGLTYTNNFSDALYGFNASVGRSSGSAFAWSASMEDPDTDVTTSGCEVGVGRDGDETQDGDCSASFMGDLA